MKTRWPLLSKIQTTVRDLDESLDKVMDLIECDGKVGPCVVKDCFTWTCTRFMFYWHLLSFKCRSRTASVKCVVCCKWLANLGSLCCVGCDWFLQEFGKTVVSYLCVNIGFMCCVCYLLMVAIAYAGSALKPCLLAWYDLCCEFTTRIVRGYETESFENHHLMEIVHLLCMLLFSCDSKWFKSEWILNNDATFRYAHEAYWYLFIIFSFDICIMWPLRCDIALFV